MGLSFFNNTPDGLYVCHLRYDPSCTADGGQPFSGHGWYRIEAGATVETWHGDAGDWDLWWGFYAISDSGRYWAGPYQMDVTLEAFSQCYDIGVQTSDPNLNRTIGFRGFVMDDDYDDYTVPLVY
jgi:hypothetical protein